MNSNRALLCLGSREELIDNGVWRCRTIQEIEIKMLDTVLREFSLIVLGLVEAHNQRDAHLLEDRHVVSRREGAPPVGLMERSRERDELAGHGPVEIAVVDLLVVLVLDDVELVVVIPAEFDGEIETIQAVIDRAFVGARALSRVSERSEFVMVRLENLPSIASTPLEDDNHEGAHKERGVCLLRIIKTSVMINLVRAVLLVVDEFFKFLAKQMNLAEIERAKVREEWLIHQIVVNAEVEGVRS